MRLIDADEVKIIYRGGFHDDYVIDYNSFMRAPTVNIVRCKECKHSREIRCEGTEYVNCVFHEKAMPMIGFCSYGERASYRQVTGKLAEQTEPKGETNGSR